MSDDELKRLLDTMRQENAAAHEETRGLVERIDKKVDNSAADVDRRFDAVDARFEDTARRFDRVDARFDELRRQLGAEIEATKHDVRLVAESVVQVNEGLTRDMDALRQEMSRGFAETQAMIKFSHVELDRRVNALEESHHSLEETVAGLQTRVQRLESGPH